MTIVQPGLARRNQEARYGYAANPILCWPIINGSVANTSSQTVSVWRNGGYSTSDALVNEASATENGSTFQLSYTLNASDTNVYTLGLSYRAQFTYTASNTIYQQNVLFDVVRTPILYSCPVDINDLYNAYTPIEAALTQASQTTDAHQRYILPAWEDVLTWVESKGWRPSLVSSPAVLRPMVLYRSLTKICEGLMRKDDDVWAKKAERFRVEYEDARNNTTLVYNTGDGKVAERVTNWTQPQLLIGNDLRINK